MGSGSSDDEVMRIQSLAEQNAAAKEGKTVNRDGDADEHLEKAAKMIPKEHGLHFDCVRRMNMATLGV